MSLRPDDRSSRDRDRSKTRDRSRSRSNVRSKDVPRVPSPPSSSAYGYSAPPPGSFGESDTGPTYEVRAPGLSSVDKSDAFRPSASRSSTYPQPSSSVPYPHDDPYSREDYHGREHSHFPPRMPAMPSMPDDDDLAYGDDIISPNGSRHQSYSSAYPGQRGQDPYGHEIPSPESYMYPPERSLTEPRTPSYSYDREALRDPMHDDRRLPDERKPSYPPSSKNGYRDEPQRTTSYDTYRNADLVEFTPSGDKADSKSSSSKTSRLSLDPRTSSSTQAPRSPGLTARTDRLSVSGNRPDLSAGGELPPPSPLLEAYRGTYQQISPMPLAHRLDDDDELEALEPLSPQVSRGANDKLAQDANKKKKKSVKVDDYEGEAQKISQALSHHRVDTRVICDILPALTHDQMMHVRREYRKLVKVQGRGVNLAKHLKTKLSGNFGKAAYVTALGRWESEGYWANFWYQSHSSRRELLIESLMGRTNREILEIKEEFRDKRYSDNLVKCMEKELKMDKFRVAVLMALEGRRQEEQDVYPIEYRNRDVQTLHKALTAKQGGESVMLEIVIRRSDAHLREVLKTYEGMYQENFPKAALKKSNNLVGEVIAHILNGVINKPARDALLLRHAIKDIAAKNKDDELRYELLVSRLVRLHWDKPHLAKVKREYYMSNKKHLEEDIEDATSGDFADFMWELCKTESKS